MRGTSDRPKYTSYLIFKSENQSSKRTCFTCESTLSNILFHCLHTENGGKNNITVNPYASISRVSIKTETGRALDGGSHRRDWFSRYTHVGVKIYTYNIFLYRPQKPILIRACCSLVWDRPSRFFDDFAHSTSVIRVESFTTHECTIILK